MTRPTRFFVTAHGSALLFPSNPVGPQEGTPSKAQRAAGGAVPGATSLAPRDGAWFIITATLRYPAAVARWARRRLTARLAGALMKHAGRCDALALRLTRRIDIR